MNEIQDDALGTIMRLELSLGFSHKIRLNPAAMHKTHMTALNKTERIQLENYRIYLVIKTIAYLGVSVHLILISLFYWLDQPVLSLLNVLSSVLWITAWSVIRTPGAASGKAWDPLRYC